MLIVAAWGCAHAEPRTTPPPGDEAATLDWLKATVADESQPIEPVAGATQRHWRADPGRLWDDLGRTARDLGWGVTWMRQGLKQHPTGDPGQSPQPYVVAQWLLPDGRTAVIQAWGTAPDRVAAAVRVGHFGDDRVQRQCLRMLQRIMAGHPKPQRSGSFELPPMP